MCPFRSRIYKTKNDFSYYTHASYSIFDSPDHESPIFLLPVRMVVFTDQDKDPRSNGNFVN
ncbi:hypothetical protein AG1IA_09115 [Rhizoctonia solani AG-1 IA]|uniref:Uncharacterized protein n=1 Tax=Thanatephorus cucumeris (strain AG1-IA) TaxID=983506 RepID=L8WJG3_THACA|nr:hypothetical protein AG1IA_09115 [Rhizoctonia solani AG-1 IA]